MRYLMHSFLKKDLSRRGLIEIPSGLGFTAAAAQSVVAPLEAPEDGKGPTLMKGTGGEGCTTPCCDPRAIWL